MKQSELLLATLTEAVAALVKRMGEVEGIARIPGPPPGADEIRKAAEEWLRANITQPKDGEPATPEQVQAFAESWLAENIKQPKDGDPGRDPNADEIRTAVELWLEFNRESIRGERGQDATDEQVADAVAAWLRAHPIRTPKDGDNASPEMVSDAVRAWLAENPIRVPAPIKGDDGDPGTGIALIEQRDDASFHITLDDGREFQIDLPEPKRTSILGGGGGGGIKEIQPGTGILVDNTDPRRPIITALGGGDSFLSLPAAGNVIAYRVVTTDADGLVIYGDAGTVAHQGRILGVCINSASAGGNVAIAQQGLVTNAGWNWTAGAELYVGLNGDITTQQVGAFSQNLGYAISATQIFIRLGRAVVRG